MKSERRVKYYRDGSIEQEIWVDPKSGEYHRETGPAVVKWYPNGQKAIEIYAHKDFGLHREDGPSFTEWCIDGTVLNRTFRVKGGLHNLTGPAVEEYNRNGELYSTEWWVDGNYINIRDYPEIAEKEWPLSVDNQIKFKILLSSKR